jgi:predicted nucleotidyltransferase component of viral defense system
VASRTVEDIAADYQAARDAGDEDGMARFQNQEACLVLLTVLERLAADPGSFIHEVAVKGGILMAGELKSPRTSADIDVTSGHMKRIDPQRVISDVRSAGREFGVRSDGAPERTTTGEVIHLSFESLTDGGTAKLEVSVRENLVFAVRDAVFDVSDVGLTPFTLHALAEVELVAEKVRALVQRAQPRDLFDLHLYLLESGWYLDRKDLARAIEAKLRTTRHKRWRSDLWRVHLDEIEELWIPTLREWIEPDRIPDFDLTVEAVTHRMRELGLG